MIEFEKTKETLELLSDQAVWIVGTIDEHDSVYDGDLGELERLLNLVKKQIDHAE